MPRKRPAQRAICAVCGRSIAINSGYPDPYAQIAVHGPVRDRCPGSYDRVTKVTP